MGCYTLLLAAVTRSSSSRAVPLPGFPKHCEKRATPLIVVFVWAMETTVTCAFGERIGENKHNKYNNSTDSSPGCVGGTMHDFCLTIPYGMLVMCGGGIGFLIAGSKASLIAGVRKNLSYQYEFEFVLRVFLVSASYTLTVCRCYEAVFNLSLSHDVP